MGKRLTDKIKLFDGLDAVSFSCSLSSLADHQALNFTVSKVLDNFCTLVNRNHS